MSVEIINLTPHAVKVLGGVWGEVVFPPSGQVARVSVRSVPYGDVAGVPVVRQEVGGVEGLPEARPGVAYVVSALVRLAVPSRGDVFSPGELVRDGSGHPVGCRGLVGN